MARFAVASVSSGQADKKRASSCPDSSYCPNAQQATASPLVAAGWSGAPSRAWRKEMAAAAYAAAPPEYPLPTEYPPVAVAAPAVPTYPPVPAGYPTTPPPEYPPQQLHDLPTAPPLPQQREELHTPPSPSYQDHHPLAPQAYAAPPPIPMQAAAGRGELIRRVPGAQLSSALRSDRPGPRQQPTDRNRNAEAERDAMQSFLDGLARASSTGPGSGSNVQIEESEKR